MSQTANKLSSAGITERDPALIFQEASPAQREEVKALLIANKLPVEDLVDTIKLYALTYQGALVGSTGLEVYGNKALLRSVSLNESAKGRGWGRLMCLQTEELARKKGIEELYLLTIHAEAFFSKLGYKKIPRKEVPQAVQQAAQFQGVCPASVVAMWKKLGGEVRG